MLKYEIKEKLRTSDYDMYDRVKIHSLFDIFQDVAGNHAAMLNIGYENLKKKNLIWVLRSQYMRIKGNIPYNEEITLRTWPKVRGRADFIRYYEIETTCGDIVCEGISKWVVINYETRKIDRASDINYNGELYSKTLFDDYDRIRTNIPHTKEFIESYRVRNDDLDHNGHMNNAIYPKIIYNMVKLSKNFRIRGMQIDYLHEALLDDKIDVYYFNENENKYFVGYVNLEEVFIARVEE